jgi:small subunit ribosomal protein S4|tara:strand:+ start:213 stop:812 length:600 start_codon:yes stop_codon:yes gene_type:complete
VSRYIGPVQKKLRSLGLESYGSIRKKETKNVSVMGRRRRVSNYGLQLKEKQKAKFLYGVQEKQFRRYYDRAINMVGITGDNLMVLLERRLDNVLYRTGMFLTRRQSRQAVNHGHFKVNGQKVDIPSYQIKEGDHITWTEKATKNSLYLSAIENSKTVAPPHWIGLDSNDMSTKVVSGPTGEDGELVIDTIQIVEFYSKR